MKKYALIGAVILFVFALFRWNGTQSNEDKSENIEENFTYETTFSSKQHVMERVQRVELLLKAIKVPADMASIEQEFTFSANAMPDSTSIVFRHGLEGAEESILTIATHMPHLEAGNYKEVQGDGQHGWWRETEEDVTFIVENEGLYYALVGSKEEKEELTKRLQTLQEIDTKTPFPFEGLKLPIVFPGNVLTVDNVYYTNASDEVLTITYVMKEEYTITYTVQKHRNDELDANWQHVKTPSKGKVMYAKEENRLMFKDADYQYTITSTGRELSLEEFLLMTK